MIRLRVTTLTGTIRLTRTKLVAVKTLLVATLNSVIRMTRTKTTLVAIPSGSIPDNVVLYDDNVTPVMYDDDLTFAEYEN